MHFRGLAGPLDLENDSPLPVIYEVAGRLFGKPPQENSQSQLENDQDQKENSQNQQI